MGGSATITISAVRNMLCLIKPGAIGRGILISSKSTGFSLSLLTPKCFNTTCIRLRSILYHLIFADLLLINP